MMLSLDYALSSSVKKQAQTFDPCFRARDEYIQLYRQLSESLTIGKGLIFYFNKKPFLFVPRGNKESYLIDVHTSKLPGVLAWIVSDALKYQNIECTRNKIQASSIQLGKKIEPVETLKKLAKIIEEGLTLSVAIKKLKKFL